MFLFAHFRESGRVSDFHDHNRLLFSFYDTDKAERLDINSASYFEDIKAIMIKLPAKEKTAAFFRNYADTLENKEKFLHILEKFENNFISFDTLKEIARVLTDDKKLLDSSFFNPYPSGLMPKIEEERDFWK